MLSLIKTKYRTYSKGNFKRLLSAALLLGCSAASAAIIPISGEEQISSSAAGNQSWARLASNSLGERVNAYNEVVNGQHRASLKFYDRYGNFLQTITYDNGSANLTLEDISMNSNGDSIAIFTANSNAYVQIFNRYGNPKYSGLVQVNSVNGLSHSAVAVDLNDNGEAIVSWFGFGSSTSNVYLRKLNIAGYWTISTLTVNNPKPYTADVAIDSAGDFVVSWAAIINNVRKAYIQHYYSGGSIKRSARNVNVSTSRAQGYPRIAMNRATGEHVVAWTELSASNQWFIHARKFNSNGYAGTSAFKVSQTPGVSEPTESVQYQNGEIWFAWYATSDNDDVFAATFYDSGTIKSAEARLNTYTTSVQSQPSITLLPNNEFAVGWQSYQQDGDGWGVYQRRFVD